MDILKIGLWIYSAAIIAAPFAALIYAYLKTRKMKG
jgi:hypothetical protein